MDMPEVFDKNGHDLKNIIAWDEFKPVLHPEYFWGITVHISTVCSSETEDPAPWLGLVSNIFLKVYSNCII